MVHCLRLCASTAEGTGSFPGEGTKTPHAMQCGPEKKSKLKLRRMEIVKIIKEKAQSKTGKQ